ncbi:hypothetical protein DCAR_0729210 [Daucus carota subsp. sativus]|uniref:Uncharacterized protein n=1 Tax=Daucus carota subsp. sativus TaxID=79200 RepID=A0A164TG57_DAUCS|nr:hypothetical protein DCAR_0729210 [Daucus carota subsp. sativus]
MHKSKRNAKFITFYQVMHSMYADQTTMTGITDGPMGLPWKAGSKAHNCKKLYHRANRQKPKENIATSKFSYFKSISKPTPTL